MRPIRVRLDRIMLIVEKTILSRQNALTGLFVMSPSEFPDHAWIRDNVYAVQTVWAMYRAYQKFADSNDDVAKANELGFTCVKVMQSLMECLMRQAAKVEAFKRSHQRGDSLHAKFSAANKTPVVSDGQWGHLQLDAIALFLLTLAQMTASGLQIVRNFDEVAFVQNLVFYIENAYRIADFGIWERGDKTNQGRPELNASSVGLAKAALQAMNDVGDLLGDGSKGSFVHVLLDEIQQCSAVLESMLPRESFSKETDAALLSIISYPAFAVDDQRLIDTTRRTIDEQLKGKYGCKRFIRDGYKTPLEHPQRLYYNNSELQQFENIECEWPLFTCYMLLDALFCGNKEKATEYGSWLDQLLVTTSDGVPAMPELYAVPLDLVADEKRTPGSQKRVAGGITPYLWAQSLYVLCRLLMDGVLTPAELDPLSRRLNVTEKRLATEVQVVILAASDAVKQILAARKITCQAVHELESVFCLQPASVLAKILERIGRSSKMKLSGRPTDRNVGVLSTSKFYQLGDKLVVFTPQFMEPGRSHLMYDVGIWMHEWRSELRYLHSSWNASTNCGRPLIVLVITKEMLSDSNNSGRHLTAVTGMLSKMKSGYLTGARVVTNKMSQFFRTTAVSKLEFHELALDELLVGTDGTQRQSALPCGGGGGPLRRLHVGGARHASVTERRRFSSAQNASPERHRSADIVPRLPKLHLDEIELTEDCSPTSPRPMPPVFEPPDSAFSGETPVEPKVAKFVYNSRLPSPPTTTKLLRSAVADEVSCRTMSQSSVSTTSSRIEVNQLEEMDVREVIELLNETDVLEEQALIVRYLWTKKPSTWDTELSGKSGTTLRMLMEEIYDKACRARDWMIVRISAGLLEKRLQELPKAVTHLLVRQKQLTVGILSNETPITCPKTTVQLKEMFNSCYKDEPNSNMLAQEIIVSLGSLVRTDAQLFNEMFRLRIGLIIQVLASELERIYKLTTEDAAKRLLGVSPYQLKSLLRALLSGKMLETVLEEPSDNAVLRKEQRSGLVSVRKKIERTRNSQRIGKPAKAPLLSETDTDEREDEPVYGVWLRHRRIDGALNRVPPNFYADVWDLLRRFPGGLVIDRTPLVWGLTQEMTKREINFALELEAVLNLIPEPEYRQLIVEALTLLPRLLTKVVTKSGGNPDVVTSPTKANEPFHCDRVVAEANRLFVERNKVLETVVMNCCGDSASTLKCDGARAVCIHFYDSAPAGECGTAHYMIKAMMEMFQPR